MTESTERQAMVQRALDALPADAMRARTLAQMMNPMVRIYLNPDTGTFTAFAGNAEQPTNAGILINADDIPYALRPRAVPDTPAELMGDESDANGQ
jgi:hypothetical protein